MSLSFQSFVGPSEPVTDNLRWPTSNLHGPGVEKIAIIQPLIKWVCEFWWPLWASRMPNQVAHRSNQVSTSQQSSTNNMPRLRVTFLNKDMHQIKEMRRTHLEDLLEAGNGVGSDDDILHFGVVLLRLSRLHNLDLLRLYLLRLSHCFLFPVQERNSTFQEAKDFREITI